MTSIIKNEDIVPLLTGRTPANVNRLFSYFLKQEELPLTKEQWSVMAVLWNKDGITQQDLADATFRDRPGITRLLDNLEKEGLTERRAHPTDRRVNLIYITKKGKELEKPVLRALKKTVDIAAKNISSESLENLRDTFRQINKNITELGII